MRLLAFSCFLVLVCLSTCRTDEPEPVDALEQTGLLGRWEIVDRWTGTITSGLPMCCEFLSFITGDNTQDLDGAILNENGAVTNEGTFAVDLSNSSLDLFYNGDTIPMVYLIAEDRLNLEYYLDTMPTFEIWDRVE